MNSNTASVHPFRIAYFAEIFPSKSETWVHHEIRSLERIGCTVQVFATHPRPTDIAETLLPYSDKTTYLPELRNPLISNITSLIRQPIALAAVFRAFFSDTHNPRNKAQVLRDLYYSGSFLDSVRNFAPDVIYAHFGGTRTNLALIHHLFTGTPFAFVMHAYDVFNRVALLRLKVERAACVFTISEYNIDYIRNNYQDVAVERFEKLSCGIDLPDFPFRIKPYFGSPPLIVGVGRLVKMKGFDILVQASRILRDNDVSHRIILLGDGPERPILKSLISETGLAQSVELRGYASPAEVRQIVSSADIFALPSVWDPELHSQDGIPVALMEAMALGIPVVSTSLSGIPELITDSVNGFLVPPENADALAQAIMRACTMETAERMTMVKRARTTVENRHSADTQAAALLRALKSASRS